MPTPLSKFRDRILIEVIGAPIPQIDREVRNAAIEFCDFTGTWFRDVPAQDIRVSPVARLYRYPLPAGSRVVSVFYVPPGCGQSLNDRNRCAAEWGYTADRQSIEITLTNDVPDIATVAFHIILKPDQEAESLPSDLFDDNQEAICAGAKRRLMAIPGKEWTDVQMASYYEVEFEKAKRKEKAEVLNGRTRQSTLTVSPPDYMRRQRSVR